MTIPWEENPAYQKAQAAIILGALLLFTIGAIVFGFWFGEWGPLLVCGAVWLGLVVLHFVIGSIFAILVTIKSRGKKNGLSGPEKRE